MSKSIRYSPEVREKIIKQKFEGADGFNPTDVPSPAQGT
jgi:hypothetical protein